MKKITKEFLAEKYDELYKKAVELQKKYSPCGFKKKGGKTTCVAGRDGKNYCKENPNDNFCCDGCRYLGADGCTTEALRCQIWFCGYLYENGLDSELKKELDQLVSETWDYGFFVFRGSKQDNLYEAYYKFGLLRTIRF